MTMATEIEQRIETEEPRDAKGTIVFLGGKNMRLMTVRRLVSEVSSRFEKVGRVRISPPEPGTDGYLLLDWEQIEEILEALPQIRLLNRAGDRRPEVVVCGVRLPLASGNEAKGCALISVSIGGRHPSPIVSTRRKEESEKALLVLIRLRAVIEKHHGTVRFATRPGKAILNFYLPVL
jgi:hypothetical protein